MRRFIIATTAATLFSSAALTQDAIQGTASIPDLSGIWAHLSCCGFEPPQSGFGPVTNRSRRGGAGDPYEYVGDYTNPILKPEAAQIVKRFGEIEASGVPAPSPAGSAGPEGYRS